MKYYSVLKRLGRSALSILLSVCLIAFLLPLNVWAEEWNEYADELIDEWAEPEASAEKSITVEEEIETSRDAFTKELVKGSGAHFYAVYPLAVHYEEGSGEEKTWKEIDNTLKKTDKGYANTAGAWEIALPEDPSEKEVSVTYKGYTLKYGITGLMSSTGEVQNVSLDPEDGTLQAQTIPKGFASALMYEGALENADLRYDLVSHQLKESVIFRSLPENLDLTYSLKGENLSVELNEDNTLSVFFGEELAFVWEAPYLYDADGFPCFDVQTTVTAAEEGFLVKYALSEEWLSSEERVFPVTFDPVVRPDILISNTQDQTVFTNKTEPYTWGMIECGRYSGYGVSRCYVKYINLPVLTSADVITDAKMNLYKLQNSSEPAQLNVHKVLASWDQTTLTWNNKPAYDPSVEDYQIIDPAGWYTWEVTDIARGWYAGDNNGMMFKATDTIENGSTDNWKQFTSSNWGGAVMPVLYLTYVNNCGIESSWDYEQTDAGRAGTGYISDFTGNLVWVREEMGFPGLRMPVTVQRIYNANDKDSNRFGMGYGWRTNYNQLVYQWSTNSSYYVWEDEDGTRQYFKYKSYGTYEDERGTGLVLTTTGSGNSKYTITDLQNNKRTFDTNGRLYQVKNNQQTVSSITVTYTSSSSYLIATVTDGVNRVYQFSYSNGFLSGLSFKGTNNGNHYSLAYTYSRSDLTQVTYPDGEHVDYSYRVINNQSTHLLETATDVDGYKVTYTYTSGSPYRVTKIAVSDDGVNGGTLAFSYKHNETTLTDHNGNKEVLQFTDWGNTVCVQDDEGRAVFSRYADEDTDGDRSKSNQMIRNSKLQNTTVNELACGGFERGARWAEPSGNPSGGSREYTSETAYQGEKSLKITGTSAGAFAVTTTMKPVLESGKTYTLSAYVKNSGGGAKLRVKTGSTVTAETEPLPQNTEWQRAEITFTCTSATDTGVFLINTGAGVVYFDCVQLEQSTSAGRYNLVDNGDFRYTMTGGSERFGWTESGETGGTGATASSTAGPALDSEVWEITGTTAGYVHLYQQIYGSGSAGDAYTFAGWAKGDSVPAAEDSNRRFCLILKFFYSDNTTELFYAHFNPDAEKTSWQYAASAAVAARAYDYIRIYLCYDRNENSAQFDGIQVFREEFGHSYVYDEKGRVVSATDLQKQETRYEYNTNNDLWRALVREGNTEKAKVDYTYDNYHNVKTAKTKEGVVTKFVYDAYGNATQIKRTDHEQDNQETVTLTASASYSTDGNRLTSVTDTRNHITTYGYNAQTGLISYIQRPGEDSTERTNYSYDSVYRNTSVSKVDTSNSYTFTDDLLTSLVNGSETTYTFTNGSFGQTTKVKIGTRTLVTNTYSNDRNRYLTKSAYGNGDYVTYGYDSHGRVTTVGYEDQANAIQYEFDLDGRLGLVRDNISNRTKKLLYDLSGRSVGYDETGTNWSISVRYGYDDLNNVSVKTEKRNGVTYTSSYSYDTDSRVTGIGNANSYTNVANTSAENEYDPLGQLETITSKKNNEDILVTEIEYDRGLVKKWKNTTGGSTDTYEYTYDDRGNITKIKTGGNSTTYVYDTFDQMLRENNQAAGKTWEYSYDHGGNITSKTEYAYTTGAVGSPLSTKTFTYGNSTWKDLLTKVDNTNIDTDEIGNLTDDGEWTYTWQHGRQLAGMSKTGTTVSFSYDADGLRTAKTVNGTVTKYYYTDGQLTDMVQGSDDLHFTYDSVGPATVIWNNHTYFYLRNAQGDICGLTDKDGVRVVSYSYDAWGNLLSVTGSKAATLGVLNPLRYRGYVYDIETGLYYLQSRYYDPEICRFINADGYASTGQGLLGSNMFAYCENNPVSRSDDCGRFWHIIAGAVGGALVGGISQVVSNAITGKKWSDGLGTACITGLFSGALAASGVGLLGSIVGNATIAMVGNATNQIIDKNGFKDFDIEDMLLDGAIGALAGAVGGPGASRGNSKSAMTLGKQLTKRIANGEIRQGFAYYTKNMMTEGGKSIYKELVKAFARGGGTTLVAVTVKTVMSS